MRKKGEGSIRENGYIAYGGKKFHTHYLHRIIIEKHIGRKLLPNEIVHHINHNKKDNRIENLFITDRVSHLRFHHAKAKITNKKRVCLMCKKYLQNGKFFLKRGYPRSYCKSCNAERTRGYRKKSSMTCPHKSHS